MTRTFQPRMTTGASMANLVRIVGIFPLWKPWRTLGPVPSPLRMFSNPNTSREHAFARAHGKQISTPRDSSEAKVHRCVRRRAACIGLVLLNSEAEPELCRAGVKNSEGESDFVAAQQEVLCRTLLHTSQAGRVLRRQRMLASACMWQATGLCEENPAIRTGHGSTWCS